MHNFLVSDKNEYSFNILILGQNGCGKSSFINQFLQEKKAKEEENIYSRNYRITKYYHPKFPIAIFDTPGFETDETIIYIENVINELDNNMEKNKNNINLILLWGFKKRKTFYQIRNRINKKIIKKK